MSSADNPLKTHEETDRSRSKRLPWFAAMRVLAHRLGFLSPVELGETSPGFAFRIHLRLARAGAVPAVRRRLAAVHFPGNAEQT